jgi:hypothetical protein
MSTRRTVAKLEASVNRLRGPNFWQLDGTGDWLDRDVRQAAVTAVNRELMRHVSLFDAACLGAAGRSWHTGWRG